MGEIKNKLGIRVGGYNVNNLKYVDNAVLIVKNEKKSLQKLLDKVI